MEVELAIGAKLDIATTQEMRQEIAAMERRLRQPPQTRPIVGRPAITVAGQIALLDLGTPPPNLKWDLARIAVVAAPNPFVQQLDVADLYHYAPANPAAGAEISFVVPAGERWKNPSSLRFELVTSATAVNRRPVVIVDDGGSANLFEYAPSNAQGASLSRIYSYGAAWGSGETIPTGTPPRVSISMPLLDLDAGYRIRTLTENLQVGDQFSGVVVGANRQGVAGVAGDVFVCLGAEQGNWAAGENLPPIEVVDQFSQIPAARVYGRSLITAEHPQRLYVALAGFAAGVQAIATAQVIELPREEL